MNQPTVILIGEDGHHLTLHVVNPDTNERQAEQALEGSRQRGRWPTLQGS